MSNRPRIVAATLIALVGFLTPIIISLQLAWNQSVADAKQMGIRYAAEIVRRGEETGRQASRAVQLLNADHAGRCSPREMELMRALDVGSSYIQMVGRISGNTLECTSLGATTPVEVGKADLVSERGTEHRLNFQIGSMAFDKLDLLSTGGVAVLVDMNLLTDFVMEGDGARLAMIVPSTREHRRLVESQGNFDPRWFEPVGRGETKSYLDGPSIVSHVRSAQYDIEGISVIPSRLAYKRVREFAAIFVPIGCFCGAGLAWAVVYISRSRSSLPGLLRSAARHNAFFVEYQPVVEIATRRIVGAEALVRWRRGNTVISPASFISLAEESGVITEITRNVMENVTRDLPRLLEISPDFRVAINFTATDLKNEGTAVLLKNLLSECHASAGNIVVEATEHGLISGTDSCRMLTDLRLEGFHVAIDDFGTGYSSLSYLQRLDLDILKIDKAFVDTIGTDGATRGVVLHIIEMAHSLRLTMVAEGIETEQQAKFLLERGVVYGQGWLFGRPMSIEALTKMMHESEESRQAVAV